MSQKIWVLENISEKQVSAAGEKTKQIHELQQTSAEDKNPSLAFSLSLVLWGLGQFYCGKRKLGVLLLLAMINFLLFMGIAILYRDSVYSFCKFIDINSSGVLLIFSVFYTLGLIVWQGNAWHAYFQGLKIKRHFKGASLTALSVVCSLLIPGWGQLLNGQIKKGLLFMLFALSGYGTVPFICVVCYLWPTLEAGRSRLIIEWLFSISILSMPFVLLMWLLNILDAGFVSVDTRRKEPPFKRMKYAIKRFQHHIQMYGWKNALLPVLKRGVLVILLLTLCGIGIQYVPREFYVKQVRTLQGSLTEKEMTLLPSLINRLAHGIRTHK